MPSMDPHGDPRVVKLKASTPRRVLAASLLLVLACLLAMVAVTGTYSPLGRLGLLCLAAVSAFGAMRVWQAGQMTLEYSAGCLREEGPEGRVIADASDIVSVERGALAFKPSNGFLLRLASHGPRVWVPGVWWRWGKLVGVGGLLPAHQSKLVAEALSLDVAQRKG